MTQPIQNIPTLLNTLSTRITDSKEAEDRQFVTALGRGLLLLAAFEQHDQLSHQQLCQAAKLPKATVTRLLHTLITLGFLTTTNDGQYRLGSSALRLGMAAWGRHDTVALAEPLLREFARTNEVSVNLATEVDGEMRYLACCRSPARLSVNLQVGSAVPIADTAIGRAFYAISTPSKRTEMAKRLEMHLPAAAFDKAQQHLADALTHYQGHGYTLSDGAFSPDILAVAVGVYDVVTGQYAYSLNASVPRANWDAGEYAARIVPKLQALAARIGNGDA